MSELLPASPFLGSSRAVQPLGHFGRAVLRCPAAMVDLVGKRLGVALPQTACRSAIEGKLAALWLGPDEWLLLTDDASDDWVSGLQSRLGDALCALVDVSHRQVALAVRGDAAEAILASGCALDLSLAAFPEGMCTRTMYDKAEIILWRLAPDAFHVEVWRSFARYVEGLLRVAEVAA
ncbi:sarcosine oxidase subunit gamma family protein [Sphingomonadaceae bacterium jetA1]|jgi:sarcosine oxidase subunit gamma|uniref:sarcosine oxidase subunit gamma n=1 Tax=Facivitalis istanbulensis TaxID=3075838 RepID=UPI00346B4270